MKITSPWWAASALLVVKRRRPASTLCSTRSVEARLVDRDLALAQALDLGLVDVGADHVVAVVGEAGGGDEAHIPGSDDADLHGGASLLGRRGRARAR
jgi:hypothetical protein